jgi:rubrerythrin
MAIEEISTASAVMSLARKLEEEGAGFYSAVAEKFSQHRELLAGLAKENKRFISQAESTYYSVISDALDGTFCFRLNPESFNFKQDLATGLTLAQALEQAIQIEVQTRQFYSQAAEQSKGLLADVPRVFLQIAQKREARIANLRSLAQA